MNRYIAYSGSGDMVSYLLGHMLRDWDESKDLKDFHNHEAMVGTSGGSLTVLARMCGEMEEARKIALSFNVKDHILGVNPFSVWGLVVAKWNLLNGSDGLFKFKNLEKTIRSVCSEERFEWYKNNIDKPVFVGVTNKWSKVEYRDLNDMSFTEAIENVLRSCTIPVMLESRGLEVDGGLIDHIGGEFLIKDESSGVLDSFYARTDILTEEKREKEDIENIRRNSFANKFGMKHLTKPQRMFERKFLSNEIDQYYKSIGKEPKPSSFVGGLLHTFKVLQSNLSKDDEQLTDKAALTNGIINNKYFMTDKVIEGTFQIKEGDNLRLYEMGYYGKN